MDKRVRWQRALAVGFAIGSAFLFWAIRQPDQLDTITFLTSRPCSIALRHQEPDRLFVRLGKNDVKEVFLFDGPALDIDQGRIARWADGRPVYTFKIYTEANGWKTMCIDEEVLRTPTSVSNLPYLTEPEEIYPIREQ